MAELKIDGVNAVAVVKLVPELQVDGITANAVYQVAGATQFRRTPRVELIEALSLSTKVALSPTVYDISAVRNETPVSAKATIDLIALEASGKRRTTPVTYNRRPISQLSAILDWDIYKPYTTGPITNHTQVVSTLNSIFGLTLSNYDFEPITISPNGNTIIKVAKESHYFVPGTTMNIGKLYGFDREYEMLDQGLNWPTRVIATQLAFFNKDTFRTEYNRLFKDNYQSTQTQIPDVSAPSTGESTNRERELALTFTVGEVVTNKKIYYNRLDLADVLGQFIRTNCWDLWEGKLFDAANLVELLTMIGLPFDDFELVNTDVVDATPGGTINVIIRAKPNSKFFRGEATITITRAPWITDLVPHGTVFSM